MVNLSSEIKTVVFLAFMILFNTSDAQNYKKIKFGNGLKYTAADSSFDMKFSMRFQTMLSETYREGESEEWANQLLLRRSRFKFDGYAFNPSIKYKFEYDVVGGQVLDAVVKWNFTGNFDLWVGQTKLPGNRERVISSQCMQFVDRSLLNARFNIDRDKGLQLHHNFNIGKVVIKEAAAVSTGEGRVYTGTSTGNDYTGRIDVLPFGEFKNKGDYVGSDIDRESDPKLALGFTYDYNNKAIFNMGQLGNKMSIQRDLEATFTDLMFKFRGLSIMSEYATKRTTNGNPEVLDTLGKVIESFYTGKSLNAQIGYLFKNNVELAGRYTSVTPEKRTGNHEITEYTLGVSDYISGHNLKIQGDLSLRKQENVKDLIIFRLQLEVSF